MRKHELVFLHSLLVLVRNRLEHDEEPPPGVFDAYEALSVTAASIDRQKAAHETAIQSLLDGIVATVETADPSTARPAVEADD